MKIRTQIALIAIVISSTASAHGAEPPPFELNDGDRVLFIGGTLIEREPEYGFWEMMLAAQWPERRVTFRNLGWSGDTVWGESRGYFDPPEQGYQNLLDLVAELKPTVIFLGYGNNESFAGPAGVEKFRNGLNTLLDDLSKFTQRIVLLSPTAHESRNSPLPDTTQQNAARAIYSGVVAEAARQRGLHFVDLLTPMRQREEQPDRPALTDNGMHLNAAGYIESAQWMAKNLNLDATRVSLAVLSPMLTSTIAKKNELFFYRWRPQNQTYLFGFRKHEQGQNAKEIAQFDPLIAEQETIIAELLAKMKPDDVEAQP